MEHLTAGLEWQTSILKMAVLWTLFSVNVPHCMTAVCNELLGEVMNFFQGHMQLLKEENIVQKLSRFSFVGLLDQVQLANRPSLSCGFVRIITYSITCKQCIFKLCDCTLVR